MQWHIRRDLRAGCAFVVFSGGEEKKSFSKKKSFYPLKKVSFASNL
jgi:hypothetical protein